MPYSFDVMTFATTWHWKLRDELPPKEGLRWRRSAELACRLSPEDRLLGLSAE